MQNSPVLKNINGLLWNICTSNIQASTKVECHGSSLSHRETLKLKVGQTMESTGFKVLLTTVYFTPQLFGLIQK